MTQCKKCRNEVCTEWYYCPYCGRKLKPETLTIILTTKER
jgi:hypothetical protein